MLRYEKELQKAFDKAKVEIESRGQNHYRGADTWKRGIYVYCNGVLSAFISNPFMHVQEKHFQDAMKMPQTNTKGFYVFTNAKTDTTQRVYGGKDGPESKIIAPPPQDLTLNC
jgi:hypothetical protein